MTLLRQDIDSKRELRDRLDSIQKSRSAEETLRETEREASGFLNLAKEAHIAEDRLASALKAEHLVASAEHNLTKTQRFLKRLQLRWGLWEARRVAKQLAPEYSDHHGKTTTEKRMELLKAAVRVLETAAEHRTGIATRNERNQLREFSKLLGKNQTAAKNFSVFDRLKSEPDRCNMLLKILPCWIMTPDDVARLFPCEPGLFDVCIIDEASQCDLPSMTPVLYRAKQAVIAGDSKQMQAQRFAFTNNQVALEAWRQHGLDRLDPDRWLDPSKVDLLRLASIRMDEEVLLNEHFRSLPSIISFSNDRWYGGQLRLMRDHEDQRFGDPGSPAVHMYHIPDGYVKPGSQENEIEAQSLVKTLKSCLENPAYAEASFGVLGLFEEQVRLLNELITDQIPEELRTQHDLVVVNPDGFQGDERDVIFYSLSYDANGMEQSQISARQAEREHIQGMLNVAFTRARDEMHVFHSADISEFGMASGSGAIRDWLEHCAAVAVNPTVSTQAQMQQTDSEFEAQVIQALNARGIKTIPQFPSAGFFIDIVASSDDSRVAVECDGEVWHLDEHGALKQEDCMRQEILERAGWRVIRVPYRGWRERPYNYIEQILQALSEPDESEKASEESTNPVNNGTLRLSKYEAAIVQALRDGEKDKELVFRAARIYLGFSRIGNNLRYVLNNAIDVLLQRELIRIEENEIFATEQARTAKTEIYSIPEPNLHSKSSYRNHRSRRRYRTYRHW
jgi:very-short-patch-repair endonuclease